MAYYTFSEPCHDCGKPVVVGIEIEEISARNEVAGECSCGTLNVWVIDWVPELIRSECGVHGEVR